MRRPPLGTLAALLPVALLSVGSMQRTPAAPVPSPSAPGPAGSGPAAPGPEPHPQVAPTPALAADSLDDWRFPVGERMEYLVTWGGARLGTSVLMIEGIDTIAGVPAYRASLATEGGPPFYRLEDRLTSWIRPEPFATLRFDQRLRQGGYRRDRRHLMDVEASTYTRYDLKDGEWVKNREEADVPIPEGALDEVAFFYFARLSELEVGERYEYDLYFKESGNPVVLEVLRRERIRVPAGTFNTIVVRPIIKTSGLFSKGGEAELYITDDERRIPVRLKTKMSIGTGNLYLTEYDPGTPGALIESADSVATTAPASTGDEAPAHPAPGAASAP